MSSNLKAQCPEWVDEFLRGADVKAPNPIFTELHSPLGSEPQDVLEMVVSFASMQRQERLKVGLASRRSADFHEFMR